MKRTATTLVLWMALAGGAAAQSAIPPGPATAVDPPQPAVTWGAEVDSSTRYIWHGLPFSTGGVVWPSAWVSGKGLTVSLWTVLDPNYDHVKANRSGDLVTLSGPTFNEYDITAAYEREIGKLTLTGTFSRYTYREPKGFDVPPGSTSEVIARAGYAVGPGEIFMTHSFDVEARRGAYYLETGYGVERELHSKSTLKVDGSIAFWSRFAEKYGVASDGPLGPGTLNVALVQQLTSKISVRPHITFMRLLDEATRDQQAAEGAKTPGVSAGFAITFGS